MTRLYVAQPLSSCTDVELSQQQIHYLTRVMRIKRGDQILVFNGEDGEWRAEIHSIEKKYCKIVTQVQTRSQPLENQLDLLFPPLKPKPLEYLVEKATEAGATHLSPILTERSTIPRFKEEKSNLHAIEAAEQCGRLSIPTFSPLERLQDKLKNWPEDVLLIIGDESHGSPALLDLSLSTKVAFLIGPEGGWSPQEFKFMRSFPFVRTVDLGDYTLRAETAALVGLATIQQMRKINEKLR